MKNNHPLSNLQHCIISLAHESMYIGYKDVLEKYYGFYPSYSSLGRVFFSSSTNSRRALNIARVSICKSFNRLTDRGIVHRVHGECGIYHSITLRDKRG